MTLALSIDVTSLNWLAILAAAIASFAIGAVWYAVLFGKAWVRLHGYGEAQIQSLAKTQGLAFALFFVSDLITAIAVSILLVNLAATGVLEGVGVATLLWLGLTATSLLMQSAAHRKPVAAYLIDSSHSLACLLVMGMILPGSWQRSSR